MRGNISEPDVCSEDGDLGQGEEVVLVCGAA